MALMGSYNYSFDVTVTGMGSPLSGARLVVYDPWKGVKEGGTTDSQGKVTYGNAIADNVKPGNYSFNFEVSHPDYISSAASKQITVNKKPAGIQVVGTSTLGRLNSESVSIDLQPKAKQGDSLPVVTPVNNSVPQVQENSLPLALIVGVVLFMMLKK